MIVDGATEGGMQNLGGGKGNMHMSLISKMKGGGRLRSDLRVYTCLRCSLFKQGGSLQADHGVGCGNAERCIETVEKKVTVHIHLLLASEKNGEMRSA